MTMDISINPSAVTDCWRALNNQTAFYGRVSLISQTNLLNRT
jgi:hypothetical protein